MSRLMQMNFEDAIGEIIEDANLINSFDFMNFGERERICEIVRAYPKSFNAILQENLFDDVCEVYLDNEPYMYDELPKIARTKELRKTIVKKHPSIIELFTPEEFDYDTIKYLWINQPYMLEEMEDEETQNVIKRVVKQLQSEEVKQIYDPNAEEKEEIEEE